MKTSPTHSLPLKRLFVLSMVALAGLVACGGGDDGPSSANSEPTPNGLSLSKIGSFERGAAGAAEITAFDPQTKRLFVVNGANGSVDVLSLNDPSQPVPIGTLIVSGLGAGVNSVAVSRGLVALAIEASPKTAPGVIAFYRASDLMLVGKVTVGSQPDMVTFTPDGQHLLAAIEGEPNSYGQADSVDPEGSVAVITVNGGTSPSLAVADFKAYIGQEPALRAQGIRIYGPGANAAQDLEPEYIAISEDSKTAWVTLQENNAVATVDIASAKVTALKSLGYKDHSLPGMGLDASDEDGSLNTNSGTPAIKIASYPVRGLYLPDAIARYSVGGKTYLVTANEGDARADWPGFNEETRVRSHCAAGLDPTVFTDAANLLFDSNLGRLRITSAPNGGSSGKNTSGQCNVLYSFGARSISVWDTDLIRQSDTGDEFEQRTKSLSEALFNSSHDNNTLDSRSPSKGPEPEGVVVAAFGNKRYAFVGLERIGGVMVYDLTSPTSPQFVSYYNPRNGATGDRGPEGLTFIAADQSPNGKPLLIVGHEVSGSTSVLQINLSYP
jgi:DNA-binding beta-propeller fold protein YncE